MSARACVPLAPYAPFGPRELADIVAATVGGGAASLMANHGPVTLGPALERELSIAEQIEEQRPPTLEPCRSAGRSCPMSR